MACEVVLKIKDLTKVYNKKRVVDGLTLNVEAGQIYGFLGPNGAGKTTTIKMITGLIKKDAGDIVINGIGAKFLRIYVWYGKFKIVRQIKKYKKRTNIKNRKVS